MTVEDIKIICNDGGGHEKHGPRNIITLRKLAEPGLDGASWREVPIRSGKKVKSPHHGIQALGNLRAIREKVVLANGEVLTGFYTARTRSRVAADAAGVNPDDYVGSTLHIDFRCPVCGLNPSFRTENRDRLLDIFAEAGQTKISLKQLEKARAML